jgi:hypothetical protein
VAGELVLANGSRLEAELANDVLVVSTGATLIDISPDAVAWMSPVEIHLKDGRVVQGVLVGDRVKARTALGELAIKVEELRSFAATGIAPTPVAQPFAPPAATPAAPAPAGATATAPAAPPDPGLPSVSLYQPAPTSEPPAPVMPAAVRDDGGPPMRPTEGEPLEVVSEQSALHREALAAATPVGRVVRGQRVTYVDSIDRRLRVFNRVIFDGGYWIKVRAADGTEGWLPASTLREAR